MQAYERTRQQVEGGLIGPGSAQVHLLAEMVDKLDELIDHLVTPKRHRVHKDAQGEVVGVEAEAD